MSTDMKSHKSWLVQMFSEYSFSDFSNFQHLQDVFDNNMVAIWRFYKKADIEKFGLTNISSLAASFEHENQTDQ